MNDASSAGDPSTGHLPSDHPPPSGRGGHVRRSHPPPTYGWDDLGRFLVEAADGTRRTPGFAVFFERMGPVERDRCERLWTAVREIGAGRGPRAAVEAEALIRWMPDEEDGSGALVVRAFAEALLDRVRGVIESGGNLYLGARPPGAQLRAFELLRLRTPLIPFVYAAANRALLDAVAEPVDVTLLDVGVGRGGQMRALLKNPSTRRQLRSLHVIGVEPDSSVEVGGALQVAEANVLACAAEAGLPVTFAGIPKLAEQLAPEDIAAARPRGLFLANLSLSLHHAGLVEHGAPRGRDAILAAIRAAGCEQIVLVEPDSDHYSDDLALRFLYAYRHYGTLGRSLYSSLSAADASLVWSEFFAQEVRNVMTFDGPWRVERHEEAERWMERLERGGWAMDTPAELVAPSAAPAGFEVVHTGRAVTLRHGGVSLLAVMRARRS